MKPLLSTALLFHQCEAFLSPAARLFISPSSTNAIEINSVIGITTRLNGIHKWRDQALELKYNTLNSYGEKRSFSVCNNASSSSPTMAPPPAAILPVLPFPFSDVLLPRQRT